MSSTIRKEGDLLAEVLDVRAAYAGLGEVFVRADYVVAMIDGALDRAKPREDVAPLSERATPPPSDNG